MTGKVDRDTAATRQALGLEPQASLLADFGIALERPTLPIIPVVPTAFRIRGVEGIQAIFV
jgi:hypothetical protein